MESWPASAALAPADYQKGWSWMTSKRGPPSPVITKYPNAIPSSQLNLVNSSNPRLLGRARFLRDAAANPNLRPDLKAQIIDAWKPLQLQVAEPDPATASANRNFCERQGRCFLGCLPAARHAPNKSMLKPSPPCSLRSCRILSTCSPKATAKPT